MCGPPQKALKKKCGIGKIVLMVPVQGELAAAQTAILRKKIWTLTENNSHLQVLLSESAFEPVTSR